MKLPHIQVKGLTKSYTTNRGQVVALDNVSIDIVAGEKVVLLGPSGCGKTTLLRCIAGLEAPQSGEITIDGKIVYSSDRRIHVPPESRNLSMVFQSYALWPHMTVFQNVAYPLKNIGTAKEKIHDKVMAALDTVSCAMYADRYPAQLSGGQQQRISLARAIVGEDGTVLFDEPLSNVDALVREQLRGELAALQKRLGFTAIYVTHDQSEALAFADRIAVMQSGRIAQIGSVRDIYERPASRYVAGFTGAANVVRGRVQSCVDSIAVVETPLGVFRVSASALPIGTAVDIVIRPEHLQIVSSSADVNAILARVELSTFLGIYTEYRLACAGQRLLLRSTQPRTLADGKELWVAVAPDHAVVFPADSSDE